MIGVSLTLEHADASAAFSTGYPTNGKRSTGSRAFRSAASSACFPARSGEGSSPAYPSEVSTLGRLRRPAFGRPCRSSPAGRRREVDRARPAPRRDLHRRAAHDAVPAARGSEPRNGRLPRARPRAPTLARLVSGRRRRNGDPRSAVQRRRFPHPTQQPFALSSRPCARRRPRARRIGRCGAERGADSRVPRRLSRRPLLHPLLPFAEWSACQPAIGRLGAVLDSGLPGLRRGAADGLRADPRHRPGARDGARPSRRPLRIGYLLSPPYFPLRVTPDQ